MGIIGAVHIHTNYSHDGRDSIADLRAWAAERGIGFLGLTDHAEDFDQSVFQRYVAECREASDSRVTVIPGLEYRFGGFPGLHLLALGLREWMEPATPAEFFRLAADRADFTIAAHPVLYGYVAPAEVWAQVDAVEVWNAAYNTRYLPDPKAMRLLRQVRARRPGVVGTAGLDQHDRRNDRGTRVVLERGNGAALKPLAELKAGRFRNVGSYVGFGARDPFPGPLLGALVAVRAVFDRVERVQAWGVRWRRAHQPGG